MVRSSILDPGAGIDGLVSEPEQRIDWKNVDWRDPCRFNLAKEQFNEPKL